MEKLMRTLGPVLIAAAISLRLFSEARLGTAGAPVFAVAEIHYVDTSGEAVDQSADHRRRLRDFEAALRGDLTASGKISNAALDCPPNACSVGDLNDSSTGGQGNRRPAPPIC
jgi:hypothetical protein